jgi:hypothetical protein
MVHCVLEFMGEAETLPDQRFGAVQHDQPAAVLPGGAAGHRQVNVGAHEDARQLERERAWRSLTWARERRNLIANSIATTMP